MALKLSKNAMNMAYGLGASVVINYVNYRISNRGINLCIICF